MDARRIVPPAERVEEARTRETRKKKKKKKKKNGKRETRQETRKEEKNKQQTTKKPEQDYLRCFTVSSTRFSGFRENLQRATSLRRATARQQHQQQQQKQQQPVKKENQRKTRRHRTRGRRRGEKTTVLKEDATSRKRRKSWNAFSSSSPSGHQFGAPVIRASRSQTKSHGFTYYDLHPCPLPSLLFLLSASASALDHAPWTRLVFSFVSSSLSFLSLSLSLSLHPSRSLILILAVTLALALLRFLSSSRFLTFVAQLEPMKNTGSFFFTAIPITKNSGQVF